MRILVVEDDARMADLLKRGLTQDRHFVEVAGDGPSGLEKARSQPYDTIVLDVMLPGLDGLGVARKLRSGGIQTPILMLTASRSGYRRRRLPHQTVLVRGAPSSPPCHGSSRRN